MPYRPPVLAERRVALVIGNDAYTHLPRLNNIRKDIAQAPRDFEG
jgi:uncharacterized caspase-like protein